MGKIKKSDKTVDSSQFTFEQALAKLEQIAQLLESGDLGLSDALEQYEQGVKYLKQCYQLLQTAEQKIELLAGLDSQGRPVTEPFDEQEMTLEEKAQSRSRRRSRSSPKKGTQGKQNDDSDDVDVARELF